MRGKETRGRGGAATRGFVLGYLSAGLRVFSLSVRRVAAPPRPRVIPRRGQSGYTLISLMIVLAVILILMTATAPSAKFEARREKELDLLHRGEQVAMAIERFRRTTNRFPLSMEELVNGVTVGIKQVHFLRPSAAKDPMTNDDWRLVRPGDPVIMEFAQAWSVYTQQPIPPQLAQLSGIGFSDVFGETAEEAGAGRRGRGRGQRGRQSPDSLSGLPGIGETGDGPGPFIAVVSQSKEASIRRRFGLESYDKWLFIYFGSGQFGPGIPVVPQQPQQPPAGVPQSPGGTPQRQGVPPARQ